MRLKRAPLQKIGQRLVVAAVVVLVVLLWWAFADSKEDALLSESTLTPAEVVTQRTDHLKHTGASPLLDPKETSSELLKDLTQKEEPKEQLKEEPKEEVPKEEPKEPPKEKEVPKEEPKVEIEVPKEEPKEVPKEVPKEELKEVPEVVSKEEESKEESKVPKEKEESKQAPKEEPQKEVPLKQDPPKEVQENSKENSKETSKENSKENPKEAAQETPKEDLKDKPKEAAKEELNEKPKEVPKEEPKEAPKEAKESPKDEPNTTPKEESKAVTEETKQEPKETSKEEVEEVTKGSSKLADESSTTEAAFTDPTLNDNRFFVKRVHERLNLNNLNNFEGYKAFHHSQLELLQNGGHPKLILFRCDDPGQPCGGLGDRMNGLISTFYLALLTDRAFMVRWTKGITWTHFVRPNEINWYPEGRIASLSRIDFGAVDSIEGIKHMLESEDLKTKFYERDIVAVGSNVMWSNIMFKNPFVQENVKKYRLLELDERGLLVQAALSYLIRPTSLVEGVLEHFAITLLDQKHNLDSLFVIALQVRTGGDGDWADRSMVPQDKVPVFAEAALLAAKSPANVIFDTSASTGLGNKKPLFFVSSDSTKAVEAIRGLLNKHNFTINTLDGLAGPITHMDRSDNVGTIERNLRTWADWFMLMLADKSIMSRSGFGETASSMICKPAAYIGPPYKYTIGTVTQLKNGFCMPMDQQRVQLKLT